MAMQMRGQRDRIQQVVAKLNWDVYRPEPASVMSLSGAGISLLM